MGFSFVSWIVMMSIFVVSPLMFICIIVMVFLEYICCSFNHQTVIIDIESACLLNSCLIFLITLITIKTYWCNLKP